MKKYIDLESAIKLIDEIEKEHPYSKNRNKPETYSDYNQGWSDACDRIQTTLVTHVPSLNTFRSPQFIVLYASIIAMCAGAIIYNINALLGGIMISIGAFASFITLIICGLYLYKITEEDNNWDSLL